MTTNVSQEGLTTSLQGARAYDLVLDTDLTTLDAYKGGVLLFIGTGGDVKVDMLKTGTEKTFMNLADGTDFPYRVKKIHTTGTTATDILMIK